MPSGIYKIAGLPLDQGALKCDVKIDNEEIQALLNEPLKQKKKKGGNKKEEGNVKDDGKAEDKDGEVKAEDKDGEVITKKNGSKAKDGNKKKQNPK
jgi:hypothetical protein